MIRIVYFGTTNFAADILKALANTQGFSIVGVVTRAPQPVGRAQTLTPSPVSEMAKTLNLTVFEPELLKTFDPSQIPSADVFVVYAYGMLIPQSILDLPSHGAINIHPSLLPKYRGPTPIQSAIINGESETGVSIMLLDSEMDHGPIFAQASEKIMETDTNESLTGRLVEKAIPLLREIIPAWVEKKIEPTPQDHAKATICKLLTRDDGKIDWSNDAAKIYNQYRGLAPWPGIWTTWNGKRLKLLEVQKTEKPASATPGTVMILENDLYIATGKGLIQVLKVQLEGAKPMDSKTFINGYKQINGAIVD